MKKLTEYNFPEELKKMDDWELKRLARQIREHLMTNVSKTGGHLASNLGVVELTMALHKVFDSPKDKILWDVGHQSYVHKILTGRAGEFEGLRTYDGISGFPKRCESPHDVYDSGHSSDSISIALGIAKAREFEKQDFHIIDVIGDGALTGGIAYEALNNAAICNNKIIIIVNDNQMSISNNIGGLTQHLGRLRVSPGYLAAKKKIRDGLMNFGTVGKGVYGGLGKARSILKTTLTMSSVFENLGLKYYGPINGHDVDEMVDFLEAAKKLDESVVLHVVTQKGRGVPQIEENADKFHGIGPFSLKDFEPISKSGKTFSKVFADKLIEMASEDERIVALSAAMIDGTGLKTMKEVYPERVIDVGIAEQHCVSYGAGLALQGMRPFVVVYSTFLQRAYDEIITNVCLQNLPVVFCIDRAGNVGADGETHNGQFDLSYLSHMPNLTIMAPSNADELEAMMEYAVSLGTPCAIRYPRGEAKSIAEVEGESAGTDLKIDGKCRVLRKGRDAAIVAAGKPVAAAVKSADILKSRGINCGVISAGFVKPLDESGIKEAVSGTELIVTIEDNVTTGGFGSMVNDAFAGDEKAPRIINLGWPDRFIKQGETGELEKIFGLDAESIADRIENERKIGCSSGSKGIFRIKGKS